MEEEFHFNSVHSRLDDESSDSDSDSDYLYFIETDNLEARNERIKLLKKFLAVEITKKNGPIEYIDSSHPDFNLKYGDIILSISKITTNNKYFLEAISTDGEKIDICSKFFD